jgi:hypothetical protein
MQQVFQMGLLAWFFFSLYAVFNDPTLSNSLKGIGEITNLLAIGYITSNMFSQNESLLFYEIGILLLIWYLYYTPKDIANPGYTHKQKFIYVLVDLCMILYLITTLSVAFKTKQMAHFYTQIDNFKDNFKFNVAINYFLRGLICLI